MKVSVSFPGDSGCGKTYIRIRAIVHSGGGRVERNTKPTYLAVRGLTYLHTMKPLSGHGASSSLEADSQKLAL